MLKNKKLFNLKQAEKKMILISWIFSQAVSNPTTNGKAIFQNPVPMYVGTTGEIKIIAALPLNTTYTLTWNFNNQYNAGNSTTLILDCIDPSKGQLKPVLIDNNIQGSVTTYDWFVNASLYTGDVNGYQLRLYDATCPPLTCVAPANGRLVISMSQPFIIYNPPLPLADNPLLSAATVPVVTFITCMLYFQ